LQSGFGRGRGNEIDNHFMAHQGLTAPVLRDEREQSVFDLVPLAGTGREVANGDLQSGLVGKLLQFQLPQPYTVSIASAMFG
jgi:hypothetical protein